MAQRDTQLIEEYQMADTSQFGERELINKLLQTYTVPKTCVEFGAYDGKTNSNTYHLWAQENFKAVLIESDPDLFAQLQKNVAPHCIVEQAFVTTQNPLDKILNRIGFDEEIGVLSIDIDSNDLEIFEQVDHTKTHIVIIEFNQQIPHWCSYRDPPGTVCFRHSARITMERALALGYGVVDCIGTNMILMNARKAELPQSYLTPNLEAIYDYKEQKRACKDVRIIGSKFTTNAKVFSVKPTPYLRLKAKIKQLNLALNYSKRGKKVPSQTISDECAKRLVAAGLYL